MCIVCLLCAGAPAMRRCMAKDLLQQVRPHRGWNGVGVVVQEQEVGGRVTGVGRRPIKLEGAYSAAAHTTSCPSSRHSPSQDNLHQLYSWHCSKLTYWVLPQGRATNVPLLQQGPLRPKLPHRNLQSWSHSSPQDDFFFLLKMVPFFTSDLLWVE